MRGSMGRLPLLAAVAVTLVLEGCGSSSSGNSGLPQAPEGCTKAWEVSIGIPGWVRERVAMPERPGQTNADDPALDHMESGDGFLAYMGLDCSGTRYLAIIPYAWRAGAGPSLAWSVTTRRSWWHHRRPPSARP